MYKCPFNYIGSKSQILMPILELIDEYQNYTLVDLFAGGFSVGINSKNKNIIYNDINSDLTKLIKLMSNISFNDFDEKIKMLIDYYKLTKTNTEAYLKLRDDFNKKKDSYLFALLIFYSFNHQIRYNKMLEFNTPFGKNRSSYNKFTEKKLKNFFELLHTKNINFFSEYFTEIQLDNNTIVYADPPYLLSTGSYNDGKRGVSTWDENDEEKLYIYLDQLNKRKIPFILSNMLKKGNKTNQLLETWSKKYKVIEVKTKYKNYRKKQEDEIEILVVNF